MRATPEVEKALATLVAHPDFVRFIEWLREEESTAVDAVLDCTQPVLVHQLQGRASVLRDILRPVTATNLSLPRLG
jgi:hypothetical protein